VAVGRAGLGLRAASALPMCEKRLPERKHLRRLDAITVEGPIVFYLTVYGCFGSVLPKRLLFGRG